MNVKLSQAKQQANGSMGAKGAAFCVVQEIHLRRSSSTFFTFCDLKKREKRSLKEIGCTFFNGGKGKSNLAAELLCKFASSAKSGRRC